MILITSGGEVPHRNPIVATPFEEEGMVGGHEGTSALFDALLATRKSVSEGTA